ncbi:MAG: MCE family protein [Chlorobi bacterium]|nr:MAG: MCE family protein [Bacteroidota bacterium]MBE2265300.1 MCE family protein [Flavobacteriales bacterium]MBL1160237.1 MCE family protein [Chlorobiota bacterium]MBW7853375.1 MCE family protein [Candidatus Kapabacteria bacterium]MCC6330422.1 MCE family protein [Ignavibacteria bacterium]
MEQTRRTEIVVGIVSIVGVALLIAGILIGKGFNLQTGHTTLTVRLSASGGIDDSAPVVVNGVKRGRVTSVQSDNGSVLLTCDIDHIKDLHPDAHAVVTILEITGGKKLEIIPGTASGRFNPKNELPGRAASDIGGLVTAVGDISGELVILLRRLDTLSAMATGLLADGTLAANLKSAAADGAVLVRDARIWMEENRTDLTVSVRDMKATISDVRRAIQNNEPRLSRTLDKLDGRLTELEAVIAKGDRTIVGVDSLISNVNGVITDIKTNKGLVHTLLYDQNFKKQVDTLSLQLKRFVEHSRVNGVNVNVGIGHR